MSHNQRLKLPVLMVIIAFLLFVAMLDGSNHYPLCPGCSG